MNDRVKELGEEARKLSFAERVALVEHILASMHKPNPAIDALWVAEVERRAELIDSGEMQTRDAVDVFADIRRRRHA